ncbi:MAG: S41 family peptidase [Bacteroidota bacterium]
MQKKSVFVLIFFVATLGVIAGLHIDEVVSGDTTRDQLRKFNDVLTYIQKYYVEDVDTQKLVESAILGMLNSLDPHSIYISPDQLQRVQESFEGSFEGIGIEFDVVNDTLVVVAPIVGGPSQQLGILAGDRIIKIDNVNSIGIKREDVPKKLRGPKGTKVTITIVRDGIREPMDYEITRDKISIYTVIASVMLDKETGYVRVTQFSKPTHNELIQALRKLKAQGMNKLILDLRDNPGGYLEQAFEIADEFLSGGKKIVYTKSRRKDLESEYYSSGGGEFEDLPLIILISNGSASASEIVAGAIQDWDRGLIVGETSFGKGLVQQQFPLSDNSAFRITTARYYTPSGRLIQRSYENKTREQYQLEAAQREEREGENLEHKEEKDSTKPIFKTAAGRIVYGGGGITPDYILKPGTWTLTTGHIFRRNLFAQYITKYFGSHGSTLRKAYESKGVEEFARRFEVDPDMLNEFLSYVKANGVEVKDDDIKKDELQLKQLLKTNVAKSLWGYDEAYFIGVESDIQVKKARSLFPEASKIAGLK